MNVMSICKYHWRRRKWMILAFILALIAVVLVSAASLMWHAREVNMTIDAGGRIVDHVSYPGIAFGNDPSRLINPSAFGMLIFILSLAMLRRDREFLVSCSVPRYRIWLGSCAFLIGMSVALSLVGGVIAPAFCRTVLLMFGFPLRGGWDVRMLFTGGDANIWRAMLASAMDMVGAAGWYMLAGYLLLRWWKPILIGFGVLVAVIILMITMVQWETFLAEVLSDLARWAEWAVEQLIPLIQELFSEDNQMVWASYSLGAGAVAMLLSYPVMRGMKVV